MSIRIRRLSLTLALTIGLAAPAAAELTPVQRTCQKRVGAQGAAYLRKVMKALRGCHDRISSGALVSGTDCTLEASTAMRIQNAAARFTTRVTAACSDAVVTSLVFGGACYGSTMTSDLVACELDAHQDEALALTATVYQTPPILTGAARACEKTVARASSVFAKRRHTRLRRCKDRIARGALPIGTDCVVTESAAITAAESMASADITADCSDATVAGLDFGAPCTGVTTSAGLVTCVLTAHRGSIDRALVAEYGAGPAGGTAVAKQIANASECVAGPLSRCRVGDYLLANDKIRVVVQDLQRNLFGIGQFGGQIIDADLVRTPPDPERDNFEEWSTAINIENTAHYTSITVLNDGSDGQAAIIRVTGVDDLLDFLNPSSVLAGFNLPFPTDDDTDLPIEVRTDYILEPGRNWVRTETTLQNVGGSELDIFFGEFLNASGEVELFQSAYGLGEPTLTTRCPTAAKNPCNIVAWGGYQDATGVSYGWVTDRTDTSTFTTSGVTVPQIGSEVFFALIGSQGPPHHLEALGDPGDSLTFTRHFIVGDGTVSSIVDGRNEIMSLATGRIEGNVTVGGVPVEGAEVAIIDPAPGQGPGLFALTRNVVSHAVTDAAGNYALTVAPGTYKVVANLEGAPFEGGGATPIEHSVGVTAFQTTTQDIALPTTGTLEVTVEDELGGPLPAKVSVVGKDASPDPKNFQNVIGIGNQTTGVFNDPSITEIPFGTAQVFFIDPTGASGPVLLEPGDYRVVVSRGPEYSIDGEDITIVAGATTTVDAQIARVVDSSGFVASDFHVHSIDSPDSPTSRRDRTVTMLAEGVDFFTPSDHEFLSDFEPTVTALGATSLVKVAPGNEITSFDYGHFNAWPMTIDPTQVNGGAVDHSGAAPAGQDFPSFGNYSLTPEEIIDLARTDPGPETVQINHIHSYFSIEGNSGLAIDSGQTPPQSAVPGVARRLDPTITNYFADNADALEIWIGDDRGQILNSFLGRNTGDWFNLLNQGLIHTGIADSDTHRRINTQSGTPRSMVASATDAPAAIVSEDLSANVNAGRSVGTNGPMVRVTVSAASTLETGGLELGLPTLITTSDGAVDVTVDVQSPIWAQFDRVEYYVNSTTTKSVTMRESGAGLVPVTRYSITPDHVQTAPADFTVTSFDVHPSVPGAERLEATTTLSLTGLTEDVWIVVMVKGTDGVSEPLFPVIPNSLLVTGNDTLADLTDGNLGENGVTAHAFSNPIFVDVDGGGWTPPGVQVSNP
jgi:hypothetical protein